jgi:glycosyltransferase involved in cell wall biosynthesis
VSEHAAVARPPIRWVGVVVPAHNEQHLLPACLAALRSAAEAVALPVELLVVLDACTDRSQQAAESIEGITAVAVNAHNVGVARRVGLEQLLRARPQGVPDAETWLATTDADTLVPLAWLTRMLAHASAGWDAVVGTVRVTDWTGHSEQVQAAWQRHYTSADHHGHVHGANLGFRADSYHLVGGMPAVELAEDAQLVAALEAAGQRVRRAGDLPVTTSARVKGRAKGGFASYLRQLDEQLSA